MSKDRITQAVFAVCRWCGVPECVDVYNCPAIKDWAERKKEEENREQK